jgi:hypothetical protein
MRLALKLGMISRGLVCLALVGAGSLSASAQRAESTQPQFSREKADREFAPLAQAIPDKLLALGYERIGGLELRRLKKDLEKVTWYRIDGGFLSGSGGTRMTGLYSSKEHEANINTLNWGWVRRERQALMALHEGLGASGYLDEDYQISLALWFLSERNRDELRSLLGDSKPTWQSLDKIERREGEAIYVDSGGITGIGGGGDYVGLDLKATLLEQARLEQGLLSEKFSAWARSIFALKVICDYSPSFAQAGARRDANSQLQFLVSAIGWNFVQDYREKALRYFMDQVKDDVEQSAP